MLFVNDIKIWHTIKSDFFSKTLGRIRAGFLSSLIHRSWNLVFQMRRAKNEGRLKFNIILLLAVINQQGLRTWKHFTVKRFVIREKIILLSSCVAKEHNYE